MNLHDKIRHTNEIANENYNNNTLSDNVDKMLDIFDSFIKNNEI